MKPEGMSEEAWVRIHKRIASLCMKYNMQLKAQMELKELTRRASTAAAGQESVGKGNCLITS